MKCGLNYDKLTLYIYHAVHSTSLSVHFDEKVVKMKMLLILLTILLFCAAAYGAYCVELNKRETISLVPKKYVHQKVDELKTLEEATSSSHPILSIADPVLRVDQQENLNYKSASVTPVLSPQIFPLLTMEQIKEKYEPAMKEIDQRTQKRIDYLKKLAANEFNEKEANNKSIKSPYFHSKYREDLEKLENQTDQLFYSVLENMERDLKVSGLPESTVHSYAQIYENRKGKLQRELLRKTAGI